MKVAGFDGRVTSTDDLEPAETGGMLAGLDVASLRAFFIQVATAGGAKRETIVKAMRCSDATIRRDIRAVDPEHQGRSGRPRTGLRSR